MRKVHEEVDEIPLGDNQRDESLKELADLQEVVDALRRVFGFSDEQVKEEMARKKQKKAALIIGTILNITTWLITANG